MNTIVQDKPKAAARVQHSRRRSERLVFSPLAWLKLMFFLHAGDTEVGGFAISSQTDPLYIQDFVTVSQSTSAVEVNFADDAVADYFDRCVDAGLTPERFARIWCHTHPAASAQPSMVDEETFDRVFGRCDWAIMFIVSRTGNTYARLSFHAGPGGHLLLDVEVDWAAWPKLLRENPSLPEQMSAWNQEFAQTVHPEPQFTGFSHFADDPGHWWDYEDYIDRDYMAQAQESREQGVWP